MVSSSPPGQHGRVPVSLMDRPKSARTQVRSPRTKTFLLDTSRWATAGLYRSGRGRGGVSREQERGRNGWWGDWRKTSSVQFMMQEGESSGDTKGHPAAGGQVHCVGRQVARQAALRHTDKTHKHTHTALNSGSSLVSIQPTRWRPPRTDCTLHWVHVFLWGLRRFCQPSNKDQ